MERFIVRRRPAGQPKYELLLEHQGARHCWAVPRGPTLDPDEQRLAFLAAPGPPEEAEPWDEGGYETLGPHGLAEQMRRGDLRLLFHGRRLQGIFGLARMRADRWLWVKKRDGHVRPGWTPEAEPRPDQEESLWDHETPPARARALEIPEWVGPMLAKQGDSFSHPDYFFELKWDGYRALAFGEGRKLRLLSRRGNSLLRQFPELQCLTASVRGREFILDGEVVCLDDQGAADFQRLQSRGQAGNPTHVARLSQAHPACYYVFDLLFLDGYDLRALPWEERRALLLRALKPNAWIRLSETVEGEGEALFALVRERGLEGMVAKHRRSLYREGRGGDWIKVKTSHETECWIVGMTAPEGSRQHFGSLVLAHRRETGLHHVGNAGSGIGDALLGELAARLETLRVEHCPLLQPAPGVVRWVEPRLRCKVRYQAWTEAGILRAPVFLELLEEEGELLAEHADQDLLLLEVEGRPLRLTHLKKKLYPEFTKGDVLRYYDRVADFLLPHLKDRPLSLKRYPDGIDSFHFFQKRVRLDFPAWLPTHPLEKNSSGDVMDTPLCNDRASLLFLVNLGCIDHNPWLSRLATLDEPDFVMFDLDPAECAFARVTEAAQALRELLDEIGLRGFPKTSGSSGLHVYVPVAPGYLYEQTRTLAHIVARLLARRHPQLFTLGRANTEAREPDRVYIDAPQNRRGATTAGPYVLRPVAGAPVSTPLEWDEVTPELDFRTWNILSAPERFEAKGDLLAPVLTLKQRLEPAVERLERLL